jgi:MFS family permease
MRDLFQARVMTPLLVIVAIQTILTMSAYAIPVVAPVAALDFGMAPSSVGAAVSVIYFMAMVTGLPTGGLIARFGAQRIFQASLIFAGSGIFLITLGHPVLALLGAMLIGCGTGPMNPAGSHVLSRVSPPNWQPLIFSIKQCGTPGGGMLAGAILPAMIVLYDWRIALYVIPALAVAVLILTMITGVGPKEPRRTGGKISFRNIAASLRFVSADRVLRGHALAGMAFAGCQLAMATYFVIYLWRELNIAPEMAGLIYATVHVTGIAARVVLGIIAGRWVATKTLLIILALIMAGGLSATALSTGAWPLPVFFLAAIVMGIGGNGWVGLFLSEIAILAPEGRAADATGGAQFYMYGGIVAGPLFGSGVITVTDSYPALFGIFAAFSLAAGFWLYRVGR